METTSATNLPMRPARLGRVIAHAMGNVLLGLALGIGCYYLATDVLAGWRQQELRDEASTEIVKFVPVEAEVASVVVRGVVEAQVGAVTLRFESGADLDYMAGLLGRLGREC